MFEEEFEMKIKDAYKNIKDKVINEQLVLEIINKSIDIFKSNIPFNHIEKQPNKEPDYVSLDKSYELDCKIFMPQEFLKQMSITNSFPAKVLQDYWYKLNSSICTGNFYFQDLEFDYKDLVKSIKFSENKNIILFYPFPISKSNNFFETIIVAHEIETLIFEVMKDKTLTKDIYLLSFTSNNVFYLRNMREPFKIEFIKYDDFIYKYAEVVKYKRSRLIDSQT
jgi:hypothetical protein